jgi:F-box/WD-40 domain protein MET30
MTNITASDPHTALLAGHDHDGLVGRTRHLADDEFADDELSVKENTSKKLEKMITPYLAQHIPQQYHPLGENPRNGVPVNSTANTKYCYRHRPDLLCRRQADEPSMEQLQEVRWT